ncbi:MAG TPA: ABC transporter permease subunit [Candidatus Binatia bacterium]|jgi:ABC-type transport system involved in multi-copper enzyme maturation permease subunit|nr:ABC transporter permease subunit [Candidatus Binatia bacterium]
MTFLPILERELRVRARRRATYWTRLAVALVGVLICLQSLLSEAFSNSGLLGKFVFNSVVAAAFLVSCSACLLTADAISSERREGTLELLLLTRIRPLDVLLGKLGSLGLTSLCALAAFLPVLMIPVWAGGVTGGDAFREGLALLDTLWVALGAGLWASAVQRERFKAARAALVLVLLVLVIPYLVFVILGRGVVHSIGLVSPLVLMVLAGDISYRVSPGEYWTSLVAVHGLAWLLVVGAGVRLRRFVRQEGEPSRSLWQRIRMWMEGAVDESLTAEIPLAKGEDRGAVEKDTLENTAPASIPRRDPHALGLWHWQPTRSEATPIEWLVYRQYGLNAGIWSMAVLALAYHGWVPLAQQPVGSLGGSTSLLLSWPPGTAAGLVGAAITAWVASRFFVAGRRSGELETLVTTPLGAATLVAEQWKVLKRLFVWPVLVMQAPMLPRALAIFDPMFGGGGGWPAYNAVASLLCIANTFFGAEALCWLALWFGLRARGQAGAIVRTVTVAKGIPCLAAILCAVLCSALAGGSSAGAAGLSALASPLMDIAILCFYLWLIRFARQRLAGELAGVEPAALNLRQTIVETIREVTSGIRGAPG